MDACNSHSPEFDAQSAPEKSVTLSVIVISSRGQSPANVSDPKVPVANHLQKQLDGQAIQVVEISEDSPTALAGAINQCQHDRIAIIEGNLSLDPPLLKWCVPTDRGDNVGNGTTTSHTSIRLAIQTPLLGITFWRWIMWLQHWATRLCFGVKRGRLQPAMMYWENAATLKSLLATIQTTEPQVTAPRIFGSQVHCGFDSILAAISVQRLPILQAEFVAEHIDSSSEPALSIVSLSKASAGIDWKQEIFYFADTLRRCWNWKWFPASNPSSLETAGNTDDPQVNTAHPQPKAATQLLGFVVLLATTLFVLSRNLNYPLFEPDEARNAQLALNIYQTGDWVSLRLAHEYYWDKPPAVAWGTAFSYHLFGVTPWATRLVSNLSAILTVMLVFWFGRRTLGFRSAWLGAMLLVLSTGFVICGRYATMDAAITLCSCTVLIFSFLACQNDRFSYLFWTVAALAAGVGFLVKGPLILVLTMPPLLSWMWLTRKPQLFRVVPWVYFGAIVALVAGPWFLAMGLEQPEFLVYFFWKHHVVRFSDAFNHREPFWYYGPILCLGMFPASLLLPSVIPFFRRQNSHMQQIATPNLGFLLLWGGWIVGFFSLSDSKLPTYILPAFPALALLLARTTEALLLSQSQNFATSVNLSVPGASSIRSRWPVWLQIPTLQQWLLSVPRRVAVSLMVALTAYAIVRLLVFKQTDLSTFTLLLGCGAIVLTLVSWLDSSKAQVRLFSTCVMATMFVSTIVTQVLPGVSKFRSIQQATAALHSQKELNDLPIVFFGHEDYGLALAMPDQETVSFDENHVVNTIRFIQNHSRCLIVSNIASIEQLRCNLDYRFELSSIKGARHVYLCHSNQEKDPAVEVIADRLKTVTLTR